MTVTELNISREDTRKLLATNSGDAVLLYLYIQCGNDPSEAEKALNMTMGRFSCASATLRQLGLWPSEKRAMIHSGERPNYSERDVIEAVDSDDSFRLLYGEVQRVLGKTLNTEELKILLGFTRYLGLTPDVISVLVNYCKDRMRQRGSNRSPSLRSIEKEAYAWAEQGIDTMEEAAAFIQNQNVYNSAIAHIKHLVQIHGRRLTAAEERYAHDWTQMGFEDAAITMAFERTCINTGGMKWPYMNGILRRWHELGLHTVDQIKAEDSKNGTKLEREERNEEEQEAITRIKRLVKIQGRRLTVAEERFAQEWAQMGFEDAAITMAYERTCVNTGGMKWPYMNGILTRWHESGLHTLAQIESGDAKTGAKNQRRDLDEDELAAIAKMMQED